MGFGSSARNVLYCLGCLESVLAEQGADITIGVALPAARAVLDG
jgi:aspartate aminotransferase-like enzyme